VLDLMLQQGNVIHSAVQCTEAGVHGHMEHVLRPVVGETRDQPDHVAIPIQNVVEGTVLELIFQLGHVIHRPVHQ